MQKKVVITGISRGLGKALFIHFAEKKYFVYGVLRKATDLDIFRQMFPENTKVILADISSDNAIKQIQDAVQDNHIDVLINNAGIAGNAHLLQNTQSAEIHELFNIHCLGAFRVSKALSTHLRKANKPLIVNINSRFGSITRQANRTYEDLQVSYAYRIAKAAQNMLTNCIRLEFKDTIEVISLHPGKMKTDIAQTDADRKPGDVAQQLLESYEKGELKEVPGILELNHEVIEW